MPSHLPAPRRRASDRLAASPDPTLNVVALVEALATSWTALRASDRKYNDERFKHQRAIGKLRAKNAETLRKSDLDRLSQTRQVDVTTSAAQAQTLAAAVQTLATTSAKDAEMLRTQLNADRAALAKQVQDTALTLSAAADSQMKDVNNRIAELQKSSYQGTGRSSVAEPMMAEFVAEMRTLIKGQATTSGKTEGMGDSARFVVAAIGVVLSLMIIGSMLAGLVVFLNR